jgi:murein DD-endopeptidase MepM/ murein hydrolase activator NlpD
MNRQREPVIGREILVPAGSAGNESQGILVPSTGGGLIELGVLNGKNPWFLALLNSLSSPYTPQLSQPLYIPVNGMIPRELPADFTSLDFLETPLVPGRALVFRANLRRPVSVETSMAETSFQVIQLDDELIGVAGTGAFYSPGVYEFSISIEGHAGWSQPLYIRPGEWTYEQITLTGAAAAIDQESIRQEWERLSVIWSAITPGSGWQELFRLPLDSYLAISSPYGAYRSYNGGPYRSYHEGVDFGAYGGTPVLAPASGTIVLAENLYVRGGAVIIDHGQSIFTGLYHMSEILVEPGQSVGTGQVIGRVGTTGLSTGNHLHWDFLVGGVQVDALAWLELNLACTLRQDTPEACGS